jgi:hypothetical protein
MTADDEVIMVRLVDLTAQVLDALAMVYFPGSCKK